jgi:hypothetical protein
LIFMNGMAYMNTSARAITQSRISLGRWEIDPVKLIVRDLNKDQEAEQYPLLQMWKRAAKV